jgi:hypothetical protein
VDLSFPPHLGNAGALFPFLVLGRAGAAVPAQPPKIEKIEIKKEEKKEPKQEKKKESRLRLPQAPHLQGAVLNRALRHWTCEDRAVLAAPQRA